MNPSLAQHPALVELRQHVAELSMLSHIAAVHYDGKQTKSTDEDIGGRCPAGGDNDRPRRPRPDASLDAWAEYRQAVADWQQSYLRRTPAYFRAELERCETGLRLQALADEAHDALEAWRRSPVPRDRPASVSDPLWKRWVAFGGASVHDVCRWYGVSKRYVYRIRQEYAQAAA